KPKPKGQASARAITARKPKKKCQLPKDCVRLGNCSPVRDCDIVAVGMGHSQDAREVTKALLTETRAEEASIVFNEAIARENARKARPWA
ncbi:MAG: hypothetical protein LBU69_02355, partial [Deltaproteobacteria bacterium]|nr:hypothetical protein [Deltaproteobacteria bacterium]